MKSIIFIQLIILLNLFSFTTYSQSKCTDQLLEYTSDLDADSLKIDLNLILSITAYEDIPFVEEVLFTSSPNNPQFFMLKKVNPEASLGYKVFDWDNTEIDTKTMEQEVKGESLITLKKHQSGDYRLVLYSKNPDGSCISLSKMKRKQSGKIHVPASGLNQNTDLKELTLLKEYNINVKSDDLPLNKKYSYVLTKGADYYFYWEKNRNLKFKVTNSKKEEQSLEALEGNGQLQKITCEATGIYYITIYAKEPTLQNSTLKLYFDEQSRKKSY
jgi:hypothetical protein